MSTQIFDCPFHFSFKMFRLMDVDGDKHFSADDLEKLDKGLVSTNPPIHLSRDLGLTRAQLSLLCDVRGKGVQYDTSRFTPCRVPVSDPTRVF